MKMTRLGLALFASLAAASPVLAADAALGAVVGQADKKTFKKDEVKAKLLALDASLDSNKLDAVLDAILDVEQEPKPVDPKAATPMAAADESPADKLRALLAGKVDDATIEQACALLAPAAADTAPESMTPEEVKAAMDGLRKELREAAEACRDVRATVGDVVGMDSAAAVYAFALDHMNVDRKGVEGAVALRALYRVASKQAVAPSTLIAQDAATVSKMFPGLDRIGQA